MQATFTYTDFDGTTKTSVATIYEDRLHEGFYAQNLTTFGCGKTVPSVRAAIDDLLGGRILISYAVI